MEKEKDEKTQKKEKTEQKVIFVPPFIHNHLPYQTDLYSMLSNSLAYPQAVFSHFILMNFIVHYFIAKDKIN